MLVSPSPALISNLQTPELVYFPTVLLAEAAGWFIPTESLCPPDDAIAIRFTCSRLPYVVI